VISVSRRVRELGLHQHRTNARQPSFRCHFVPPVWATASVRNVMEVAPTKGTSPELRHHLKRLLRARDANGQAGAGSATELATPKPPSSSAVTADFLQKSR